MGLFVHNLCYQHIVCEAIAADGAGGGDAWRTRALSEHTA